MKILITGAASGIGLACHRHYSSFSVTAIDKNDVDLTDEKAINAFIVEQHDVDVFIHCAGVREIEAPHEVSCETWNNVMSVNLTASFLLSKGLICHALANQRSLKIVNIASVSGMQAELDRAAYVASKYGLIGLTKQLAFQYGKHGITVNAIAPGIIETPLTQPYFNDPVLVARIKQAIPVGYWGQVEHVMSLVDVCLTNDYINGAVLVCDGGWTIGRTI